MAKGKKSGGDEYIVKHHTTYFLREVEDAYRPGQTRLAEQLAHHGQKVSTATKGDDPTVLYGVRDVDLARMKAEGALFTDQEVKAMEAGVTDNPSTEMEAATMLQPKGDTRSTLQAPALGADDANPSGPHPLTFHEMSPEQLSAYISSEELGVNDLLEIVSDDPTLASAILNAESIASDSEPREELVQGIAAILGTGSGKAPEGSEGVEGTLPEDAK
jgi:hypothetical protein